MILIGKIAVTFRLKMHTSKLNENFNEVFYIIKILFSDLSLLWGLRNVNYLFYYLLCVRICQTDNPMNSIISLI